MTPTQAKQLLNDPKFQAFANGEEMELRVINGEWFPERDISAIAFLTRSSDIRIKPTPAPPGVVRWQEVYGGEMGGTVDYGPAFREITSAQYMAKIAQEANRRNVRIVKLVEEREEKR